MDLERVFMVVAVLVVVVKVDVGSGGALLSGK